MNELEKMSQPEEGATPREAAENAAETCQNAVEECVETQSPAEAVAEAADEMSKEEADVCVETESPALEVSEAADAQSAEPGVCAETESPALAIAEAADEDVAAETVTNYHSMTREQLIEALRAILATDNMEAHREVAAIKQAFYAQKAKENQALMEKFVEEGNDPAAFSAPADDLENELKTMLGDFREKRNAYLEKKEDERRANLEKKKEIIAEINSLVEDIDNINLHFSKFQELQAAFKAVGEVPPGADNDLWKSYQQAVEQFYDRRKMNKELRDLDFKKNLEVKKRLLQEAKDLADLPDPVEAFKRLQVLHEEWKQTGPVAKELRDSIWEEFREATTVVNKRHQDYFQNRKSQEMTNETAKTELCEKIEAIDVAGIKSFNDWETATRKIIEMQADWRKLGYASKKNNAKLFTRFRKACDDFFHAKAEFYKRVKEDFSVNLEKKIALCERAEALLETINEKGAHEEMAALQAEWKTIGTVSRKHSEEVWQRFSKACSTFYDSRKKLLNSRRSDENANLAAKREVIEALKAISPDTERREAVATIRDLQNKWQEIGHVPFKMKDKIYAEYREVVDALWKSFDMRENKRRISNFAGRVAEMGGDENKMSRERDRLYRAIDAKRSELKTYENNMGFFNVKSSAGNSMFKELERRIAKIKDEIAELNQKVALLDEKAEEAPKE